MFFEENVSPSARRAGPRKCFHVEVVGWTAVARPRRGNIPLKCFPVAATGAEMFPRQRGAGIFPRRHRQIRGNISGRSDGETFRELHPVDCFPVAATQPFTTATGKHSQECFPVGRILPRARRAGATGKHIIEMFPRRRRRSTPAPSVPCHSDGETYFQNVSPSQLQCVNWRGVTPTCNVFWQTSAV